MISTFTLDAGLSAPPAFKDARGYLPLEGGRLVALDLVGGRELWTATVRVAAEPVAGEGLVFVAEPDALTALREEDGAVAWRFPFAEALAVPLVWDNGWLIAANTTGSIIAFRATDGHLLWRRDIGSRPHAPPALAADRVYVPAEDGRIVALRVDTGAPVWERRLGGSPNAILALDDRLYVGSTDKFFYCVEAEKGQIAWRWRTGGDVIGVPVVDDRRVYFVSLDNILRALDRRTGAQRWKRPLPLRPIAGPLHATDLLLVAGLSPTVRAYRARDGVAAGDLPTGGEAAAQPHVVNVATLPTPLVVVVAQDVTKGTMVWVATRAIEPPIAPIGPLPNPTPVTSGAAEPPALPEQSQGSRGSRR